MGKYADIVYYPSLSIAENAALNKVQEKDIRYYIRSRGIDRRNEERQPYISKIKDYLNEHPNATRKETADALGFGINTIRKYWSIALADSESNQNDSKESIRKQREDKAIEYLNSLPVEFIRKYLKDRMDVEKKRNRVVQKRTEAKGLKPKIKSLIHIEHENTRHLKENPSYLPKVTKQDLYKTEKEQYNVEEHYCVAFRRKEDLWKGIRMPFGNMNSGFAYEMHGATFPTSEHAYIAGLFSGNTDEYIAAQRELLADSNGHNAKKVVRRKYAEHQRRDWREFNVEWMLYCVWSKVTLCVEFRDLLMAIPEGAMLIEDTSFQHVVKPFDSPAYWGARNPEKKAFENLVEDYAETLGFKSEAAKKRYVDELLWDYCNVGVYTGNNVMGKILTYIKQCLHDQTAPDIDYDLLQSKKIHILGKLIDFKNR